jgi:hypothetical protein
LTWEGEDVRTPFHQSLKRKRQERQLAYISLQLACHTQTPQVFSPGQELILVTKEVSYLFISFSFSEDDEESLC